MADILVRFNSPCDKFSLIIEDNGRSAWAFLKDGATGKFLKDTFVYSPIEPLPKLNEIEQANKLAPTLVKKYASESAVMKNVSENKLRVVWSENGDDVAILYEENPLAAIYSSEKYGYSKALSTPSGFGNPWSQELYSKHFAKNC